MTALSKYPNKVNIAVKKFLKELTHITFVRWGLSLNLTSSMKTLKSLPLPQVFAMKIKILRTKHQINSNLLLRAALNFFPSALSRLSSLFAFLLRGYKDERGISAGVPEKPKAAMESRWHKVRRAGTWDSAAVAVVLTPGQTSPRATKYKETVCGIKNDCIHAQLGQIMRKKIQKS